MRKFYGCNLNRTKILYLCFCRWDEKKAALFRTAFKNQDWLTGLKPLVKLYRKIRPLIQ